jgi:hypothetical protein
MKKTVRVGAGSAAWGDLFDPAVELCEKGDIEYIGFDHLSELTMAILTRMRQRDANRGYIPDMVELMKLCLPACRRRGIKVITNGGGANLEAGAREVLKVSEELGLKDVRVGVIAGDEVPLERLDKLMAQGMKFPNRDTGAQDLREIRDRIVAAHIYIGSEGIIEALKRDANVVIAGRVSDNALYVGPIMYEFGWDFKAPYWNLINAAVTAGHIIECADCCCGGMSTQWRKTVDLWRVGFPILEFQDNGEFAITKVPGSGGLINEWTIKEHLVYEVHDPRNYLMPDGIADFTTVKVEEAGKDRVKVTGCSGKPRPDTLKLCVAYEDGWIGEGIFVVPGPDALEKARFCEKVIRERLKRVDLQAQGLRIDYMGINTVFGETAKWPKEDPMEVPIRIAAKTKTREEADKIRREITHMWTLGPVGMEVSVPSDPRRVINLWHTLIPRSEAPAITVNILQ